MNIKSKKYLLISLLVLITSFIITSCYDDVVNNPIGNLPPETGMSLYPDSTIASQPSRLNISWWGDDPDGLVKGFYFSWDGINWTFTPNNDSLFSLQIGAVDTIFQFQVAAVDAEGNGKYDSQITQNGINFGPEPFVDKNANGTYDAGEFYYDIGLIDPTPAVLNFPIKNTAPTIGWNVLTKIPQQSFPVMSFGWNAADLDGDNTIEKINIVLNDTTNPSNIISLNGGVRTVTLRTKDFNNQDPLTEILIEGLETNIFSQKLPGIKLNDNNRIFIQAVDISGAKSKYITLPDSGKNWFVKKPVGKLLIVDDSRTADNASDFYNSMMDSLGFSGKFDVYDYLNNLPPYLNVTFLQTLKFFTTVLWYSDNSPSLDLAASSTQKFLDGGGKVFFSLQFPQIVDLGVVQTFLPIIADSSDLRTSLLSGTVVSADLTNPAFPKLQTTQGLFRLRTFYLNPIGSIPLYYFPNNELRGYVGFMNNVKSLFFIGLPLHRSNGGQANVKALLDKVLLQEYGITP